MTFLRALLATMALTAHTHHTPSPEAIWLSSRAAQCILWNESTDGKYSANIWQFQGVTWHVITGLPLGPGSYSVAVQDAAAYKLYRLRGWEPWSSRFVCGLG